jgi:proteasome lid subunit RPN8/RPN11
VTTGAEYRRIVILPQEIRAAIEAHARHEFPYEACGLIAADGAGAIRMAYPLSNVERSTSRFTIHPDEHWGALQHAERNGWQIGGAFHSHPTSAPMPSRSDVDGALDPDWIHLIAGPVEPGPVTVRAFRIVKGVVSMLDLEVRA